MGTELVRPCVKEENMDIPSIPPGFESLTTFTLKREEDNEMTSSCSVSASASESQTAHVEMEFECSEDAKITRSLRRRPWINYGRYDNNSGDESDSEQQVNQAMNQLFLNLNALVYCMFSAVYHRYCRFLYVVSYTCICLQSRPLRPRLPKGVIRGCDECSNCQKVSLLNYVYFGNKVLNSGFFTFQYA